MIGYDDPDAVTRLLESRTDPRFPDLDPEDTLLDPGCVHRGTAREVVDGRAERAWPGGSGRREDIDWSVPERMSESPSAEIATPPPSAKRRSPQRVRRVVEVPLPGMPDTT